ncbi:KH domain-containing, RNA-binding, signal transduction-associated protein 3, partial [Stegodyphus mimosarum]
MAAQDSNAKINNDCINELIKAQELVKPYSQAYKVLQQEIDRLRNPDSDEAQKKSHIEVHSGKQFRLRVKVHIPVDEHPNFNFVGKLLGPKGSSLQQLQEATQTKMAILGRGSMRDKQKEEELRNQGDPKYSHLHEDLHVEITAYAAPAEAYRRMASAIAEIQRFLVPNAAPFRPDQEYFDDMRPPQYDGKPKPPFVGDGPPHMAPRGPPLPPRPPMGPPMMAGREPPPPPRRPVMAQSSYAAPEGEEWAAPPRPAPRRGGYAAPAARAAARPYEEPANDYNNYGEGYAEYNSGTASSYYDYAADTDGHYADGYGAEEPRAPIRSGGGRGRNNARLQSHPYAGATRRGY